MRLSAIVFSAIAVMLLAGASASAQSEGVQPGSGGRGVPATRDVEVLVERSTPSWYGRAIESATPRQIIQRKAQARAAARIRRIEANNAYGISNARPTASVTPLAGLYSPAWQLPGGRPWAWYTGRTPRTVLR